LAYLSPHAPPHPFQIDANDAVKVRFGHLHEGRQHRNARIVKRIIQTPIGFKCPLEHGLDGVTLRDIRLNKEGVPSRLLDHPDGFFAFRDTTRRNNDAGTVPSKRYGGCSAYTGVSSGD
jgi:hypothetical protein